jgi:hypothetical protein
MRQLHTEFLIILLNREFKTMDLEDYSGMVINDYMGRIIFNKTLNNDARDNYCFLLYLLLPVAAIDSSSASK